MNFVIEQYPKNKTIDFSQLSLDQIRVRVKAKKKYTYGNEIRCNTCGYNQPTEEYYIRNKVTGKRNPRCRDCVMKQMGVIEIGKQRFSNRIADKGLRRCSICKDIKPLTEYTGSKKSYLGKSNTCYECSRKLLLEFTKNRRLKNRKPNYFIDGKDFVKKTEFARYVNVTYGIPISTTMKRIQDGKTEEQCKLSQYEMRSLRFKK